MQKWLTVWLFKYGARKLQQSICFNWDLISVNIFINATQNSSKVVNTVIKKTQNNVYGKRFDRNRKITRYDPILNSRACNNITTLQIQKRLKRKPAIYIYTKQKKKFEASSLTVIERVGLWNSFLVLSDFVQTSNCDSFLFTCFLTTFWCCDTCTNILVQWILHILPSINCKNVDMYRLTQFWIIAL